MGAACCKGGGDDDGRPGRTAGEGGGGTATATATTATAAGGAGGGANGRRRSGTSAVTSATTAASSSTSTSTSAQNRRRGESSAAARAAAAAAAEGGGGGLRPIGQPHISWRPMWRSETPITMKDVLKKRDEFWDTAPAFDGRQEIWAALRTACETDDADFAQTIVSAANITLPHGNLSVAYDELGNQYNIPAFCLSLPLNLISASNPPPAPPPGSPPPLDHRISIEMTDIQKREGGGGETATKQENNNISSIPVAISNPEVSAAVGGGNPSSSSPLSPVSPSSSVPKEEEISLKIKFNTGEEMPWVGSFHTTMQQLKREIATKKEIGVERQRVIYSGRMLTDSM